MSSKNSIDLAPLEQVSTTTLIAPGRRSGQPRSATIWFVVVDGRFYVGSLRDDRDWIRNAMKAKRIELVVGETRLQGSFCPVDQLAEIGAVQDALRSKYLGARIAGWFGKKQKFIFRVDDLELTPAG